MKSLGIRQGVMFGASKSGWWRPSLWRKPQPSGEMAPVAGPVGGGAAWPMRPDGPLIWLQIASMTSRYAMEELARRLSQEAGISVLLTGAGGNLGQPSAATVMASRKAAVKRDTPQGQLLRCDLPPDHHLEVTAFLDHWRPDALVLSEGELRGHMMGQVAARGIHAIMVDARQPSFAKGCESWLPGALRRAAQGFAKIYAIDASAVRAFRKLGLSDDTIEVTGRISEGSRALPYLEAERDYLAKQMVARPIWFAASIPESEEAMVLAAHRHSMQMSHRMMLILLPQNPERAEVLARDLAAEGWNVAARNDEVDPDSETEIYLVADHIELGLWYRLAAISYLGGGIADTGLLLDPFEPAALGSAVLHGPRPGKFGPALGRLGAARALRAVASAKDLREALADLLASDRTAKLAQAAWAVISEGAELSDKIVADLRLRMSQAYPEGEG